MDPTSHILEQARSGNAEEVVRLAKSNPFLSTSATVEPALLVACEVGHLSVVRALVEELRVNPNCVDASGRSPLHLAVVRKTNGKVAVTIIKFLVSNGAKIRKSVLHVCANELAVFPLIELGADKNAKSVDGLSPLEVAVQSDREEVVAELIRAGAEVSENLLFKAKSGNVVKELVRAGLPVNSTDSNGKTPLSYAVQLNNKSLARALLECNADPNLVKHPEVFLSNSGTTSSSTSFSADCPLLAHHTTTSTPDACALPSPPITTIQELFSSVSRISDCIANQCKPSAVTLSSSVAQWDELEKILTSSAAACKTVKQKIQSAHIASLCAICHCEAKSVVLLPCRHFCICGPCSKALRAGGSWDLDETVVSSKNPTCPICRTQIQDYVPVYT